MESKDDKLCPSSTCHEGAIVLGVKQGNDEIALLNFSLQVTADFVAKVQNEGSPEKRMRFADTCVKNGCAQWTDGKCGVINELVEVNPGVTAGTLPKCIIRPQCRWFAQEGAQACTLCPFIITDNT